MSKTIDRIKKKIYSKIYNVVRQGYLKESISNIGKIVEEEDKIICYIEQKKVEKYKKILYELNLYGMNKASDKIRKINEKFGLNKPVYYIFDNIEFSSAIRVSSIFSSHIIFKNCTFDKNIIIWFDEVTFENNKYNDSCDVYFYGDRFLNICANKITFINDNFVNSYKFKRDANFGMKINSKIVEFINTKVDIGYPGIVRIEAKETKLENSELNVYEFDIDSKSIQNNNSTLIAKSGVIIENEECNFIGIIDSPIIFYNGIDLGSNIEVRHKVNKEEAQIKEARQKLIKELSNIRNYCQQLNNDKVQAIKESLDNQDIAKILKSKKVKYL